MNKIEQVTFNITKEEVKSIFDEMFVQGLIKDGLTLKKKILLIF